MTALTRQQLQRYAEHGFAVGGPLLEGEALGELRRRMDAAIAALAPGQRSEHMASLHYADAWLRELFLSAAFVDVAGQILGPDVALFTSYAISKPPGDGLPVAWHQDAAFFPIEPMRTFTLWLAVDDADRENGCMQVLRGSHRARLVQPHVVDASGETVLALQLPGPAAGEAVDVEVPAGWYSVHDPYIVHGSPPNRSARRRCGITIKYVPTSIRLERGFRSPTGFDWRNVRLYHARGARGALDYAN
ncbi:MAG: phytanoyl-CoA dioxygenase family protein [Betaproteobacteria bacterium]